MDKKFRLVIDFKVNEETGASNEAGTTYGGLVKIKTFIDEFFIHPQAVASYYWSHFMEHFIVYPSEEWEILSKHIRHIQDFSVLFTEISKNCPKDVARFIADIFKPDGDNTRENIRRQIEREMLMKELRTLMVSQVHFYMLKNPEEKL